MPSPRILVVDDEADLRELVEMTLVKMGLDVDSVDSLAAARSNLLSTTYSLVLTDMCLPDGMGTELVQEVSAHCKNTPIAVITAYGSADNAVAALKAGAFDYLSKPVGPEQLRSMVQAALRMHQLPFSDKSENQLGANTPVRLIGQSNVMQELRAQIVRLARSMAPVAIYGESGSGKELAARDIHAQSARADKRFVAVNCGAIPEALMEAEFFGYRKGAFTGAAEDRDGFFQAANGGTLMLDEVADLPLAMQVKLLRAIQERRVRKIGATTEEPVDVRLISATHYNLADCVEKGKFRQDLYYRLNVIGLSLPPLRERLEDIELLAAEILSRLCDADRRVALAPAALDALRAYHFPGNVRELENILERALAFADNGVIEVNDLALRGAASLTVESTELFSSEGAAIDQAQASVSSDVGKHSQAAVNVAASGERSFPHSLTQYLDDVERDIIQRALEKTRYNRTQAAELLGISFRQLRYRMQRLNICEPEYDSGRSHP